MTAPMIHARVFIGPIMVNSLRIASYEKDNGEQRVGRRSRHVVPAAHTVGHEVLRAEGPRLRERDRAATRWREEAAFRGSWTPPAGLADTRNGSKFPRAVCPPFERRKIGLFLLGETAKNPVKTRRVSRRFKLSSAGDCEVGRLLCLSEPAHSTKVSSPRRARADSRSCRADEGQARSLGRRRRGESCRDNWADGSYAASR
jgi:hypothetical protein